MTRFEIQLEAIECQRREQDEAWARVRSALARLPGPICVPADFIRQFEALNTLGAAQQFAPPNGAVRA